MNAIQLTPARRIIIACLASIATIALYFYTMTRGIAAGALIGLPTRVVDVVALQREARYGMYAAVLLQLLAALTISPLVPLEASDDHRVVRSTFRFVLAALLSVSVTAIVGTMVFAAIIRPQHRFTGYPPFVHLNSFLSCPSDGPCIREDTFRVDPIPRGCCTLEVTNGDGRGLQTPFSENISHLWAGGMWHVDPTHNTLITTGNAGTESTAAQVMLFYNGGKDEYRLEKMLSPGQQLWLDVGELIRDQVPDSDGHVLPRDLMNGSYELRDLDHATVGELYEGKLVVDKTYGHASYGCAECCGYETPTLNPNPFGGPPGIDNDDVIYGHGAVWRTVS